MVKVEPMCKWCTLLILSLFNIYYNFRSNRYNRARVRKIDLIKYCAIFITSTLKCLTENNKNSFVIMISITSAHSQSVFLALTFIMLTLIMLNVHETLTFVKKFNVSLRID